MLCIISLCLWRALLVNNNGKVNRIMIIIIVVGSNSTE